ncbi:MAG: hypothetical protein K6G30_09475 [Acetatifactor sp.]|nr:hypothetical protein [Acetatifactor sp.]
MNKKFNPSTLNIAGRPTARTMDVGLQYDFVSKYGAGTVLGNMMCWPILKLEPDNIGDWKESIIRLINKEIVQEDVEDDELKIYLAYVAFIYENEIDLTHLKDILNVLERQTYFYSFCSGSHFEVFDSFDPIPERFWDSWCSYLAIAWDDMSVAEREHWIEQIDAGNFDELAVGGFGDIPY